MNQYLLPRLYPHGHTLNVNGVETGDAGGAGEREIETGPDVTFWNSIKVLEDRLKKLRNKKANAA